MAPLLNLPDTTAYPEPTGSRSRRRRLVPLAVVAAVGIWAIVTHILLPALVDEEFEGVAELTFAILAGITIYVATDRSDRARQREDLLLADVHALETSIADVARERRQIASRISRLRPEGSLEHKAAAIARELTGLRGVDFAAINVFEGDADVVTLGAAGTLVPMGFHLPPDRARAIRERAQLGAWSEAWTEQAGDGRFGKAVTAEGVKAVAMSPIGSPRDPVGVLLVGATSNAHADRIVERLPALVEFATITQGLIGQELLGRREEIALRSQISDLIARRAFEPVYQPIVTLATNRAVGFEALTRFDGGLATSETFAAAIRTGLGDDLEAATLAASIAGSDDLPSDAWLAINVSPGFAATPRFAALVGTARRGIVVEITEHAQITDYQALRAAMAALGPDVRVAVDDAGAGIANFAHMLELGGKLLKLDVSLIRNVDADPTRQALIQGIRQFALTTGQTVIAEGIESPKELETLRALGVELGQGYILGRPLSVVRRPARARAIAAIEPGPSRQALVMRRTLRGAFAVSAVSAP